MGELIKLAQRRDGDLVVRRQVHLAAKESQAMMEEFLDLQKLSGHIGKDVIDLVRVGIDLYANIAATASTTKVSHDDRHFMLELLKQSARRLTYAVPRSQQAGAVPLPPAPEVRRPAPPSLPPRRADIPGPLFPQAPAPSSLQLGQQTDRIVDELRATPHAPPATTRGAGLTDDLSRFARSRGGKVVGLGLAGLGLLGGGALLGRRSNQPQPQPQMGYDPSMMQYYGG